MSRSRVLRPQSWANCRRWWRWNSTRPHAGVLSRNWGDTSNQVGKTSSLCKVSCQLIWLEMIIALFSTFWRCISSGVHIRSSCLLYSVLTVPSPTSISILTFGYSVAIIYTYRRGVLSSGVANNLVKCLLTDLNVDWNWLLICFRDHISKISILTILAMFCCGFR